MKKRCLPIIFPLVAILIAAGVSFSAHAQGTGGTSASNIGDAFIKIAEKAFAIVVVLIPVAFGAAVVFFLLGTRTVHPAGR